MSDAKNRQKLVQILQNAYSGEMAAAFAYRGHWKSLQNGPQKDKIRSIEEEEWHHRRLVLEMLFFLGSKPRLGKEILFWSIGKVLGVLCFVAGWFWPMFFAGRLETANVCEYATACGYAEKLKLHEFASQLKIMSAVERDHESFFTM